MGFYGQATKANEETQINAIQEARELWKISQELDEYGNKNKGKRIYFYKKTSTIS